MLFVSSLQCHVIQTFLSQFHPDGLEGGSTIYMELPRSRPAKLSDIFGSREELAEIDCLSLRAISFGQMVRFTVPRYGLSTFSEQCSMPAFWQQCSEMFPEHLLMGEALGALEPNRAQPEVMGLAAGGKLIQGLVVDRYPSCIWNASRTRLINLHIISPASFEAVTHIVPPETPITARAYADAGLPFYVVEEGIENRLDSSDTLGAVKSVSQIDKQISVGDCGALSLDTGAPRRCGVCKTSLCDCMCVIPPRIPICFCPPSLMNFSFKRTAL